MNNQNNTEVYSYHTFLFPFLYIENKKSSFSSFFDKNERWENTNLSFDSSGEFNKNKKIKDEKDKILDYALYQYFNFPTRKVIFGEDNDIVKNYLLFDKNKTEKFSGKYIIEKDNEKFELSLYSIKLKIFNTGVGVLIFELENYNYKNVESVEKINEYGRRVAVPFIVNANDKNCFLCADKITIKSNSEELAVAKIKEDFETIKSNDMIYTKGTYHYISDVVKEILNIGAEEKDFNFGESIKKADKKKFDIIPVIDDRMFVACIIRDAGFVAEIKGNSGYDYKSDFEKAKELYALSFIDVVDSSCQNKYMIKDLLNKHIYDRWIEYGTIHAITHHSLICVTGDDDFLKDTVINPFLTQYIEMAIISIVQRASMIKFSKQASEISTKYKKSKNKIIKKIISLQEDYTAFKNQLLLFELTPQEQGIEIYEMLKDSLYISRESDGIESQIQNLYEVANVRQQYNFNKIALIISLVAALLTVLSLKDIVELIIQWME